MTIEKKRTVTVQNDIYVYFAPEEIFALHRAMDILRGIADPSIYPDDEDPLHASDWCDAADTIEEILDEAERNNSTVLLYSGTDGES